MGSALEVSPAFVNSFLDHTKMQFRLNFKKLQWTLNAKPNPKTALKKVTGSFSSFGA